MYQQLIDLLKDLRPEFGAVGSRDVDVRGKQERVDAALAALESASRVTGAHPVIAWENPSTGAILREESRDMCDTRRQFWLPLISGAAQFGTVQCPVTFSVGISTYEESHRTTYHVIARRSDRPVDADLTDETGTMHLFYSEVEEHARIEQRAWEAFLCGATPTRHVDFVTESIDADATPERDVSCAPSLATARALAIDECIRLCRNERLDDPTDNQADLAYETAISHCVRSLRTLAPNLPLSYQARVNEWMQLCFGALIAADRMERHHRFFEEATELVQAGGMTRHEAHQLVDYTYDRPKGELKQEVGGVMVTLAALCNAWRVDMYEAGEIELTRINIPSIVAKIRAKQAAKPKHSPLPAHVALRSLLNAPSRIFLSLGDIPADATTDFQSLSGVTWCEDRTGSADIEYVRAAAPVVLEGAR